jgi:outer membrane receptor for ferrienterochelin and colicins
MRDALLLCLLTLALCVSKGRAQEPQTNPESDAAPPAQVPVPAPDQPSDAGVAGPAAPPDSSSAEPVSAGSVDEAAGGPPVGEPLAEPVSEPLAEPLPPPAALPEPLPAHEAPSEASLDAIAEMSLEELLTAETTVASSRALSVRESPGVITTITRDEILASGARDLVDVLLLVPGVFVGVDVLGALGVGMRGLWGHEGKILFLLNGHTLNEMSFLTTPLGSRIPVELLERVEVIRGPGSVRYGGYAELAVVNMVTIQAEPNSQRAYASGNYGQMHRNFGRGNVSAAYASNSLLVEDLSLSIAGHFGKAHVGDDRYHDLWGDSFELGDGHAFSNRWFDASLGYRDLTIRYQREDYRVRTRDGYDVVTDVIYDSQFLSHHLSVQYDGHVTDKLTLTPRFEYHRQFPFNAKVDLLLPYESYSDEELAMAGLFAYDRLAERTSIALRGDLEVLDELTLSAGAEYRLDRAVERNYQPAIDDLSVESLYAPDSLTATFYNLAAFAEASTQNRWLNATAGARYEYHQQFGSALVPRLALSKVLGDLHFKALAAQAFKSPGLENINLNPDVKREQTTTFELELGYRVLSSLLVTVNAFDLTVKRPIVYFYDAVNDREGYANRGQTGSRGAEAELRYEHPRARVVASYAFYTARHKNHVDDYAVPGQSNALLAAPNHKVAVNGRVRLVRTIYGNLTGTLMTERYAQTRVDENDAPVISALDPALLLNLFVEYRDFFTRGLTASAGAYNLSGQRFSFPQPYTGLHGALPAQAREYLVRLSYAYN